MNVVQSYLTTIMKGDFSLYEIRIFVKIVELANQMLDSKKYSKLIGKAFCADGINCNLEVPIKEIMTDGNHDYKQVKEALNRMKLKSVELMDGATKTWYSATLLGNIRIREGEGTVKFVVPKWLLEYIVDFMYSNYTSYELKTALTLPSAYAVRLYWLTNSMKEPVKYSVQLLKEILGCSNKYKETKDFIKRCIEPSRKIFEERHINGFSWRKVMKGNKCTSIEFTPVKRQEKTTNQLVAMAGVSAWCEPVLKQYLIQKFGFRVKELAGHKDLLFKFSHLQTWQDDITRIARNQEKKRAGKGYVVNAIKNCVAEHENNIRPQAIPVRKIDKVGQRA